MRRAVSLLVIAAMTVGSSGLIASEAEALVLCAKVKRGNPRGALRLREKCGRREMEIDPAELGLLVAGPPGAAGAPGTPGAPGTDGQLRIYGNGSAGARSVDADETLDDTNLQYTDFTVATGMTLTVRSGTVIRCSGTFTNDGTIVVEPGAPGARRSSRSGEIDSTLQEPHPGVSRAAAASGEFGPPGNFYSGGYSGTGLDEATARQLLRPGLFGGGGGGTGTFTGGDGGGALTVLAALGIVNAGTIMADGQSGDTSSGGGAGGVVLLASRGSVTNRGLAAARGGNGGPSSNSYAPGGGGGGGIVHLIAPVIDDTGVLDVAGGSAGTIGGGVLSGTLRYGGGGGGGCGGNGGGGGGVSSGTDMALAAGPGMPGHALKTAADPTALY